MQALALFALINALGWHAGDVYKATGRPDIQWKLSIGQAVVLVPILIGGARLDGIVGVAIAQVVAVMPYSLVRFWLIRRILGIGSTEIASALRVPLLAGAALFGVCLSVGQLPIAPTSPALVLALQALAGGAVYGAVVLALDPGIRLAVRLPISGRGGMGQPVLGTDVARAAHSHRRDGAERRGRRVSNAEYLERLELDDG
jgi:PST family polysaccharide transporter